MNEQQTAMRKMLKALGLTYTTVPTKHLDLELLDDAIRSGKAALEQREQADESVACEKCGKAIKEGKVRCVLGRHCWVGQQPAQSASQRSENTAWVGLDAANWFEWWRTATVLEHTQAEIDFADFLLIATAVQDVLREKNGGAA